MSFQKPKPRPQAPQVFIPHNPRLAEQMAKRKLLWGGAAAKKAAADAAAAAAAAAPQATANSWEKVEFAQDDSGTQASKFLRLMGMKNADSVVASKPAAAAETDSSAIAQRAQMFSNMERQYEAARKVTHNAKGKGFGSAGPTAQKKYF